MNVMSCMCLVLQLYDMSVAGTGEKTVPVELTGVSYPQGADGMGGASSPAMLQIGTTEMVQPESESRCVSVRPHVCV